MLTVSESSKRDILRFVDVPADKIDVIYNAYDERFGIEPREEDVIRVRERYQLHDEFVLYAGNVKPHKNLERLIEAFDLVRKRGLEHLKLVLIGDEISEVRGAPPGGASSTSSTSTSGSSAISRKRRWPSCTGWPAYSSSRRSTKGSGFRRSKRWRAARPS